MTNITFQSNEKMFDINRVDRSDISLMKFAVMILIINYLKYVFFSVFMICKIEKSFLMKHNIIFFFKNVIHVIRNVFWIVFEANVDSNFVSLKIRFVCFFQNFFEFVIYFQQNFFFVEINIQHFIYLMKSYVLKRTMFQLFNMRKEFFYIV